jgi:hypothetical protein
VSFLYIIAASPEGPVKLGFSADPRKRLKQLQTGSVHVLALHHTEEVDDSRVKIAERALHKLLGHRRLKGEWFSLSVEEAVFEVVHIRMCEG